MKVHNKSQGRKKELLRGEVNLIQEFNYLSFIKEMAHWLLHISNGLEIEEQQKYFFSSELRLIQ